MKKFTLLELLIVIIIIAILFTMLLPSLTKAKQKTVEVSCLSDRKQAATALALFGSDNKQHYPTYNNINHRYMYSYFIKGTGEGEGLGKLNKYVKSTILNCQTQSSPYWAAEMTPTAVIQRRWLSYNGRLFNGYTQENSPRMYTGEVKVIFGDLMLRSSTLGADHPRKTKTVAFYDRSVKLLNEDELSQILALPNWPTNAEYMNFWDSLEEHY